MRKEFTTAVPQKPRDEPFHCPAIGLSLVGHIRVHSRAAIPTVRA
jgi:hypothetical protein